MKKYFALLLCLALLSSLVPAAQAFDYGPDAIVDDAQLLTVEEEADLRQKAAEIYDSYGIWVGVLTVNTLSGKTAESYADDYYDSNYYRDHPDGVLLLIAMETREWHISTCGTAIGRLTDYELDLVFHSMANDLSDNRFYDAFLVYMEQIYEYSQVIPDTEPGIGDLIWIIPFALLVGSAAGGITLLIMRGQMNTAKAQKNAANYLVNGSYQLKKHVDIFLYSRVTKIRKPQNNGSSTHRSSGGVRHGGRGGRF